MKTRWMIPLTFLLTVLVWMALSWPLPAHMTTAITVSSHGGQDQPIRYMIPSDSLQLLYYFQLVREWITGVTPFFFNLYEFNTGDDAERYFSGGYYVPFSLVYSAVLTDERIICAQPVNERSQVGRFPTRTTWTGPSG